MLPAPVQRIFLSKIFEIHLLAPIDVIGLNLTGREIRLSGVLQM